MLVKKIYFFDFLFLWTAVDLLKKGHNDIRNEYAVIGGDESKRRGIVLAKSMPAKKRGYIQQEKNVHI